MFCWSACFLAITCQAARNATLTTWDILLQGQTTELNMCKQAALCRQGADGCEFPSQKQQLAYSCATPWPTASDQCTLVGGCMPEVLCKCPMQNASTPRNAYSADFLWFRLSRGVCFLIIWLCNICNHRSPCGDTPDVLELNHQVLLVMSDCDQQW